MLEKRNRVANFLTVFFLALAIGMILFYLVFSQFSFIAFVTSDFSDGKIVSVEKEIEIDVVKSESVVTGNVIDPSKNIATEIRKEISFVPNSCSSCSGFGCTRTSCENIDGCQYVGGVGGILGSCQEGETQSVMGDVQLSPCTSVSQYGITWTFDGTYECGQFVNGDWWVIGPVTITSIQVSAGFPSPVCGANARSGSMVNPRFGNIGYDSRGGGVFDSSLCRSVPISVVPGDSVVSTISHGTCGGSWGQSCMKSAAVLTIVDIAQSADKFRPPATRPTRVAQSANDPLIFSINQANPNLLPSLTPVASTPALSSTISKFERPWIAGCDGWQCRSIYPSDNMPEYGQYWGEETSEGALQLMLNYPSAQKEPLVIGFTQVGIDLYGALLDGGSWVTDAGHFQGRKWPILFAGIILNNNGMKNIGTTYNTFISGNGEPRHYFAEDGHTYYYDDPNLPLYTNYVTRNECSSPGGQCVAMRGQLGQTGQFNGEPGDEVMWRIVEGENFGRIVPHEHLPINQWSECGQGCQVDAESYRRCCSSHSYIGYVLAARLMGAQTLWNHDALFDYADRWMMQDDTAQINALRQAFPGGAGNPTRWIDVPDQGTTFSDFVDNMWDAYRGLGPQILTPRTSITYPSITSPAFDITFTFNCDDSGSDTTVPCMAGQYVNGDWFVVANGNGDVWVTAMTPTYTGNRNGWQVSPSEFRYQGYDSRVNNGDWYNPSLVPSLPYRAGGGDSIIKTASEPNTGPAPGGLSPCWTGLSDPFLGDRWSCIRQAAILTIVDSAPTDPQNTFRPPPVVNPARRGIEFYYDDIRTNLLPNVPQIASSISQAQAEAITAKYRLGYHQQELVYGYLAAEEAVEDWGTDMARFDSEALFWLMQNNPLPVKKKTLVGMIQNGIDYWGAIDAGSVFRGGGGGNMQGFYMPTVFAAEMLDSNLIRNTVASNKEDYWEQMMHNPSRNDGEPLWGIPDEWGTSEDYFWDHWARHDDVNRDTRDPYGYIDGGGVPGTVYQDGASSSTIAHTLVSFLVPDVYENARDLTLDTEFFDYGRRIQEHGLRTLPDQCAAWPVQCDRVSNPTSCTGYRVTWGPDPNDPGDCIENPFNPRNNRFSPQDGFRMSGRTSQFINDFIAAYWSCSNDCNNPCPGMLSSPVSCSSSPPQCSDGIDNDGDGQTDYPADTNCVDANDNSEFAPPSAPTNLINAGATTTQVNLQWNDNSNNEDGFYVERRTMPSGSFAQIGSNSANDNTFTDGTVSASTSYEYRVRAYNSGGNSGYSNVLSVTTPSPPTCAAQGGDICAAGEYCPGTILPASDSASCCSQTCTVGIPGLRAHYRFNENSGTTTADSSGNGNTGTLTSGPIWAAGRYNSGIDFDGVDDFVNVPDSSSLDLGNTGTMMAWVNVDTANWNGVIAKANVNNDNQHAYTIEITPSNSVECKLGNGAANVNVNGGNVALNTWTHIACSWDGTTVRLYINGGTPITGAQTVSPYNNNAPLKIGTWGAVGSGDEFDGTIDEVRLYDRALSLAEITDAMNNVGGTQSYALTVTRSGSGGGSVNSNPAGIICGADCAENYNSGTVVTLTATPNASSTFAGWSGGGCSGTGSCIVTMNSAQSVNAQFNAIAANQAPNGVIDSPSGNVNINVGQSVNFAGSGSDPDNNLPLTFLWNFGGGATNSNFEDPGNIAFNTPGVYTVTFTVTDSLGLSDPTPATRTVSVNGAPTANAGNDQTITLPLGANLDGTVTDDGLPNPPGAVTIIWSKVSGPGTVNFGNANAVDTTATFSAAGTYVLRLTANDSQLTVFDEIQIIVNPAPCSLTGASWSTTNTVEGSNVQLIVSGNNCAGQQVNFAVWEDDLTSGDDFANAQPVHVFFVGNTATGTWTAEWQDDCDGLCGDPEYYFIAVLASNGSVTIQSSNLLTVTPAPPVCTDGDGDGYNQTGTGCGIVDCNDGNSSINPGATEICDGVDNNCVGGIDEGVTTTFYRDQDGDGFGNSGQIQSACSLPGGYVANNLDCNDSNNAVYPNAPEQCDGVDNQCPGNVGFGTIDENNGHCSGGTPFCSAGSCVACLTNNDCSNGLFCDGAEICSNNVCVAGTSPVDDGLSCTIDTCDETNDVVINTPNNAVCQNGLWCDGTEVCNPGAPVGTGCVAGAPQVCNDGLSCSVDSCDEEIPGDNAGTCQFNTSGCLCDDNSDCNDGNSCTDDVCNISAGTCQNINDDTNTYDDGLFCTINDRCVAGSGVVDLRSVDDGVSCTVDSCDEVNNLVIHTANDNLCDDGLWCTGTETCDLVFGCSPSLAECLAGQTCNEENQRCEYCGDGIVTGTEECDDLSGAQISCINPEGYGGTQTCSSQCLFTACTTSEFCGDGVRNGNEECDDNNTNSTDLCDTTGVNLGSRGVCTFTFCGDGVIQTPNGGNVSEQCDDGNMQDGDGCSASCQIETSPPPNPPSGGGGSSSGGGGRSCTPRWNCGGWSECVLGEQIRVCTDSLCSSTPREERTSCFEFIPTLEESEETDENEIISETGSEDLGGVSGGVGGLKDKLYYPILLSILVVGVVAGVVGAIYLIGRSSLITRAKQYILRQKALGHSPQEAAEVLKNYNYPDKTIKKALKKFKA